MFTPKRGEDVHSFGLLFFCSNGWGCSTAKLQTYHPTKIPTNKTTLGEIVSLGIQSPCQKMIGVSNHLLRKVYRFHYHSQKVIGSLGFTYIWLIFIVNAGKYTIHTCYGFRHHLDQIDPSSDSKN